MRLNSNDQPLDGGQLQTFRSALRNAFFQRESLAEFLHIQLNKRLGDVTSDGDYMQQLLNIADKADEEGWSGELLLGACLWRPQNAALALFAQQFGLMPTSAITDVFESKVRPLDPDLDVGPWCARLAALAPKICLIDFPSGISSKLGTGFLVGASTVMTSFHVMRDIFANAVDPTRVSLRFDYKVLEDGRTFSDGVTYHLSRENWWLDYSEVSPLDGKVNPGGHLPDEDHLDYILLHVEGRPGLDPIGGAANKQPQPERRGWIDLSVPPQMPAPGMELFILHHPDGKRLKITLNTTSVQIVNSNGTRMLHKTNTANGTSGAPCFNHNWEPIALHQTGDPAADKHHPAELNQSIPLAAIWKRLARQGMLSHLGDDQQGVQTAVSPLPVQGQTTESPGPSEAFEGGQTTDENVGSENSSRAIAVENLSPYSNAPPEPDTASDLPLSIEQARMYLNKAQRYLLDAMALFPHPQAYILPEKFDKAIHLLANIAQDIEILKTALDRTPSLSLVVKAHIGDLHHQLNIIVDQIELYLLPAFYQRFPGNFTQLHSALNKVERYFSREE